jgi:hypothetical protein
VRFRCGLKIIAQYQPEAASPPISHLRPLGYPPAADNDRRQDKKPLMDGMRQTSAVASSPGNVRCQPAADSLAPTWASTSSSSMLPGLGTRRYHPVRPQNSTRQRYRLVVPWARSIGPKPAAPPTIKTEYGAQLDMVETKGSFTREGLSRSDAATPSIKSGTRPPASATPIFFSATRIPIPSPTTTCTPTR